MGWDRDPSTLIIPVNDDVAKLRTRIALDAFRGITLKSPVDTGRFRSSNVLSYARLPSLANRNYAPGLSSSRGGGRSLNEGPATRGSLNAANAALAERAKSPFEVVYISNSLPYAGKLEDGSSTQADQGVYGITFNEIRVKYAL